jgi:hypothetical protein
MRIPAIVVLAAFLTLLGYVSIGPYMTFGLNLRGARYEIPKVDGAAPAQQLPQEKVVG